MYDTALHWLYVFADRVESYRIPLVGCAIALLGVWILIRTMRKQRPAKTQSTDKVPALSSFDHEPQTYAGRHDPAMTLQGFETLCGYAAPNRAARGTGSPPPIREVDGELAPLPRAQSLNELPDVTDVLATTTYSRSRMEQLRELAANPDDLWDGPTPKTRNERPESLKLRAFSEGYESFEVERMAVGKAMPESDGAFDVPTEVQSKKAKAKQEAKKRAFDVPTDVYPNEFGLVLLHERRLQRTAVAPMPTKPKTGSHPRTVKRSVSVA